MLDECRGVVDGMHDLKKNLDLMWPPDHLLEDTPYRQVNDFNPNRYFDILTHLKMVEGYKLDYVYSAEELGGMPQLYARRSNREQFQSYAEFLESFGEADSNVGSFSTPDHRYDYLENIRLAKAPQSYFELITLAKLGDHFYLWWHAGYHDEIILCDPNDLEAVDANLQSDDLELPENVRDRIGEIDFKPVVIVGEKVVTVRFITFTKWGGFYENVYVMDKENPLHIIETQYNPLIEYDCGMRF